MKGKSAKSIILKEILISLQKFKTDFSSWLLLRRFTVGQVDWHRHSFRDITKINKKWLEDILYFILYKIHKMLDNHTIKICRYLKYMHFKSITTIDIQCSYHSNFTFHLLLWYFSSFLSFVYRFTLVWFQSSYYAKYYFNVSDVMIFKFLLYIWCYTFKSLFFFKATIFMVQLKTGF